MIPEIGHFSLILALCLAFISVLLPFFNSLQILARPIAFGQCLFILISFIILVHAFVTDDFSVAYVAANSNSQLPLAYKFAAVWGAHEGSMLLWVTILAIWMTFIACFSQQLPLVTLTKILAVLAIISIGFLLFLLTNSDPFLRLLPHVPLDGNDLNPLLQDPGLAIHPPILYAGYVGFAVPFACVIAALWEGKLDASWARWSRPWTLLAWCFLTYGIVLGSWWAYRVLGWGGWWFWDPVENASLLPWLMGTALIHSLMVAQKRETFKAWTALMAIFAFSLSLLGTFLVRSGILISVHAFAVDPSRGEYMLKFLLFVIASAFSLYAWRGQAIKSTATFSYFSRESLLLINNLILFVITLTVLLGTVYPLIIDILGLGKLSVGAPYFNAVFIPLITPLLLAMGLGPHCHWQNTAGRRIVKKLGMLLLGSCFLSLILVLITRNFNGYLILGVTLACWVIATALLHFVQQLKMHSSLSLYGMVLAHMGVGICVLGITFTVIFSTERDLEIGVGESAQIGAYQFHFSGLENVVGPNWRGLQGNFTVTYYGNQVAKLSPQKRVYVVGNITMSHAAINAGIFRDLYIALGDPIQEKLWSVRIYYKPFIRWLWAGGFMIMLGGLMAAFDKRYRHYHCRVTT